jgi:hypothetical protein
MQESKKQTKKTEDKIVPLVVAESVSEPVVLDVVKYYSTKKLATKKATKSTAKKATAKPKAAAEKSTSTRKTLKTSIFIQHEGKEIEDKDIIGKIKEIWVAELGNKISDMKTLTTYIKPEEQSIYYVINDGVTGRIDF